MNKVIRRNFIKKYSISEAYNKFLNKFKNSNKKRKLLFNKKTSDEQLSLISDNLAEIYKNGIPINTAIELVEDVITNKSYKNSLTKVLTFIKEGRSLSEGFKEFESLYPSFFTGIISIGENSGKLYEVLKGLSSYYDKMIFIKKEVINACIYPMLIFASLLILAISLLNNIVPNFYELYKDMNIMPPTICKFFYEINTIAKINRFITLSFVISWGIILPMIILKCLWKIIKMKILPKINIVRSAYEYMLILLFSIITSSGVNISHGLEYCEQGISSQYIKEKINEINKSILNGHTLNESLQRTGGFSKYTLAIVKIREETGSIEEGFRELSTKLEENLKKKIQIYLTFIKPILVSFTGFLILGFLIFFILPLFDNLKIGIR